jgi:putative sugar O-methyltransferase
MFLKNSLKLEGYETTPANLKKLYQHGIYDILWPKSPMLEFDDYKLSDEYCRKIEDSLKLAYEKELDSFDKTKEWDRIAVLIKKYFFDEDGYIIKDNLIDFRKDNKIYQELFNDQFNYLDISESYTKSYLKSIDLILEYHRLAKKVDKTLLASLSESSAGNNFCLQYRGKRVSEKSLFHALVVNDLIKSISFNATEKSVILDIGSGYGGLSRILHYYTPNSCHILLDLPETLILTSYFIKYNFPKAKIALLDDIVDKFENFDRLTQEYDFIIIPPSILTHIKEKSIDLVINTASMGFMQKEYLDYYLTHTDRVLKDGGYFYSLNKEYSDHWGIGMYEWDFKATYTTRLFEYNNRFSYSQWLGQKV